MNDLIKNFLEHEQAEIKKNKFRVGAGIFFALAAVAFAVSDFGVEEEVISTETLQVAENISPPAESEVKKFSEVQKVETENITAVIGANSEILFVKDPFQSPENQEVEEVAEVKSDKVSSQPVQVQPAEEKNSFQPEEKFILSGTAVSENQRTALVQRYKGKNFSGTIILQVGDSLNGSRVVEISDDFVAFDSGEKIYIE